MTRTGYVLSFLFLAIILPVNAAEIHVPADQPTIQAGIDAATHGDTVIVANGTWTGVGNRDLDFNGKAVTLRSAGGATVCIIDCQGSESDPHRAFRFYNDETADTVVQGFTIRNAWWESYTHGGAIHAHSASPTIRDNIFTGNYSTGSGDDLHLYQSTSLVSGNTFIGTGATNSSCCIRLEDGSVTLDNNTISGSGGYGVYCDNSPHDEDFPTITNNLISGNEGGIRCSWSSPLIEGNTITGNGHAAGGGGVMALSSSAPVIHDNLISNNSASRGGGIMGRAGSIIGNRIIDNTATGEGGGIHVDGVGLEIRDNLIQGNQALGPGTFGGGGGINILDGAPLVENNLIVDNQASAGGGGIRVYFNWDAAPTLVGNTIARNTAGGQGGGIKVDYTSVAVVARNTIMYHNTPNEIALVDGGDITITHSDIQGGYAGTGNIDADPRFVTGAQGDYYLSQTAAGQSVQSPCVDAGDPADPAPDGTTRTDGVPDAGRVDLGYHYRIAPPDTRIVSGPSGTVFCPVLTFTYTGEDDVDPLSALRFSHRLDSGAWSAWSATDMATYTDLGEGVHHFEVRCRDSAGNVDPTPAESTFIIEPWTPLAGLAGLAVGPGPGPGNPPLVRTSSAQWLAYGVMRYGVNLACGNIDGSGFDEVLTGPGPGPQFGPQVRAFTPNGTPLPGVSFFAYGTLKYGVNVGAGDIDGDGLDEIITGAGPGAVFGPHVRGWNVKGSTVTPVPGVSYFAYGTLKWGVNVSAGDIDGDGFDEIVTGAGPGAVFGAHVRGWDYDGGPGITAIPQVSFLAYGTPKWGVNVACGDVDGDGRDEIITGAGPGAVFGPHVRAWDYQGGSVTQVPGASWFAYSGLLHGARVAAADVDDDGIDEIVTMPGPDPEAAARLRAWNADGGSVALVGGIDFLAFDAWVTHGGSVAGGNLD